MSHTVRLDGHLFADAVPACLLNSYLEEQMKLHGWRVVALGFRADGGKLIDVVGADGQLREIEVTA